MTAIRTVVTRSPGPGGLCRVLVRRDMGNEDPIAMQIGSRILFFATEILALYRPNFPKSTFGQGSRSNPPTTALLEEAAA